MYELAIRDLSSLFKGKREKALVNLKAAVKRDSEGVVNDFLKYADEKAWKYAGEIFGANKKGVFLVLVKRRMGIGEERILQVIGYSNYIPKLREFWKLYDEVKEYQKAGKEFGDKKEYKLLVRGDVNSALKLVRKKVIMKRGIEALSKVVIFEEVITKQYSGFVYSVHGFEARSGVYILSGGHDRILHVYDENGRERFKKEYSGWIGSVYGFEAKDLVYIMAGGYDKTLHVYDENGRERFKKEYFARVYNVQGFEAMGSVYILSAINDNKLYVYNGQGRELFTIKYAGRVESVHGFEARGEVYILVGGQDKTLHVYDENGRERFRKEYSERVESVYGFGVENLGYILVGVGNRLHVYTESGRELFTKQCSDWVRSVCGFAINGKVYILVGGNDKKLHIYNGEGKELITKKYPERVRSVHGFEAGNKLYILSGGEDKKLYVSTVRTINVDELLSLQHWAESVGIETNFCDVMKVVDSDLGKGMVMAERFIKKLNAKKMDFENLSKERENILVEYKKIKKVLEEVDIHEELKIGSTYEEMKEQIPKAKRKLEEWEKLVKEYRKLKSERDNLLKRAEELKNELNGISIEVSLPEIGSTYEEMKEQIPKAKRKISLLENKVQQVMSILKKYDELEDLAKKAGKKIPDVRKVVKAGNLKVAERMLGEIDEKNLRKLANSNERIKNAERVVKEYSWVKKIAELGEKLSEAKSFNEKERISKEILDVKKEVDEILNIYDDNEVRNLINVNLEKAEENAIIKNGYRNLEEVGGYGGFFENEVVVKMPSQDYYVTPFRVGGGGYVLIKVDNNVRVYDKRGYIVFTKEYPEPIKSVYPIDIMGEMYIAVIFSTDGRGRLYVYNEKGVVMFVKNYSHEIDRVYGFKGENKVYIVVSGKINNKGILYFYSHNGRELFAKRYKDIYHISDVYGFKAGSELYILVMNDEYLHGYKLYVYDSQGTQIFTKEFDGIYQIIYGFEARGKVYIMCGSVKNKKYSELYVWDGEGKELFTKKFSEWIFNISGFEDGGHVYIVADGASKSYVYNHKGVETQPPNVINDFRVSVKNSLLSVYDEQGKELFTKNLGKKIESTLVSKLGGRRYVFATDWGNTFYVYDEKGNEIFTKKFSDSVKIVTAFEWGKMATVVIKGSWELYFYYGKVKKPLQVQKLLALQRWAERVGIETDFEEIAMMASKQPYRAAGLALKLMNDLADKKEEYEKMKSERSKLEEDIKKLKKNPSGLRMNIDIILPGDKYEDLKANLPRIKRKISLLKKKAQEYQDLLKESQQLNNKLDELKQKFEGSGIELPNKLNGKSYTYLKKAVPKLRGEIKNVEEKAQEYKELLKERDEINKELESLRALLKRSGIKVPKRIEGKKYSELKKKIPEMKKAVAELKKMAETYGKAREEWAEIKKKLKGVGVDIGAMPEKYEILLKKLKELKSKKYEAKVDVGLTGEIVKEMWSKGEIVAKNEGEINVEDVRIEMKSDVVEVRGIKNIGRLKRGETKKLSVRIKSTDAGYVPVEIRVRYRNPLIEREEERTIFPEIFVKKEMSVRVEKKEGVERHISVGKIKDMYGLEEEEEYKWGEFESYKLEGRIGSGGFSVVYKVKKGRKIYAMKIPKGVDLKLGETLVLVDKELEQYGKEALIWAMLTERVPEGVVNLVDAGTSPFPWFVMELADRSLAEAQKEMSYDEKIKVIINLLGKLDKIHKLEVVHKDIKPDNILYAGGEWKFTDFGLSKIISRSSKSSQIVSGTLMYMAPEQISKKKFGHTDWRTDIWQMGVMLYELLTGHLPFEAEDAGELAMGVIMEDPDPATEYGVDEDVWKVIGKALQKKKENRWQSAAAMKSALEEVGD